MSEKNRLGEQVFTPLSKGEMDALTAPFDEHEEEDGESKAEILKSTLKTELSGLKGTLESISELSPEDPITRECLFMLSDFCSNNKDLLGKNINR